MIQTIDLKKKVRSAANLSGNFAIFRLVSFDPVYIFTLFSGFGSGVVQAQFFERDI